MQMVRAVLLLLVAATATEAFFSFTPTVKMATFNAALIPPFPQLEERRDILIEQVYIIGYCHTLLSTSILLLYRLESLLFYSTYTDHWQ